MEDKQIAEILDRVEERIKEIKTKLSDSPIIDINSLSIGANLTLSFIRIELTKNNININNIKK